MFQDLFNHYLKRNQGYERMKRRLSSLEKEVAELQGKSRPIERKKEQTSEASFTSSPSIVFPPTITINLNKNENSDPLKAYTKRITKRGASKRLINDEIQQAKHPAETHSTAGHEYNRRDRQVDPPSHPTYIEFLNVETIIVDRYEQSNNFGALGIKSLEGKLNIGANYGDKSDLPEEAKKKLEEKLKMAKELKTYKESKDVNPPSKMVPQSMKPKPPWDAFETLEDFPDWDNFFSKQPCEAENNKKT